MQTFGDRLRDTRDRVGITQEVLAERLDRSHSTVVAWEKNERSPTGDQLVLISGVLRVNLHWLLTGDGPRVLPKVTDRARLLEGLRHYQEFAKVLHELGIDPTSEGSSGS